MSLNNIDLDTLEIFRTVASEGSITKAANQLHRVQSNISTRIIQLEERLGVSLFHRINRTLELTSDGEQLLPYANQLLNLARETDNLFRHHPVSGNLKVGSMESTAASRLPGLLASYHQQYPEIQITLTTDTTESLITQVTQYQLDAAFVASPIIDQPTLTSTPVFQENLVLICATHKQFSSPAELLNEKLITFRAGCAYRKKLENWISDMGGAIRNYLEMNSYHAIIACVSAGSGIALIPESVLNLTFYSGITVFQLPETYAQSSTLLIHRSQDISPRINTLHTFFSGNAGSHA